MATAPVAQLDAYREGADRFIAALDEEYYLHFGGLKETFDLTPIYERHADLATLEACRLLGEAAATGDRGALELWRFACEVHLGEVTREETEAIASLEASLTASVDGEEIPFRMLRPALANEPDRDRRARLESARRELAEEHLNPKHLAVDEARRQTARALGSPTYRDLYVRFGFPLDDLARQCERFLAETEELYEHALDRLFASRVGISLAEAEPWDIPRLFRGAAWDSAFPADRMVPALEATLAGLGIDLRTQSNVELDLEARPTKSPRAFCAPIEVPGRVVLVIQPIGGPDDWHAFFHEAGHTEHYAHTAPDLPVEARRLGDNAVTEGWAMLFEQLVNEPVWLERRLDFPRPHDFAAEAAAGLLYFVRRHAAKLLYELELHGEADLGSLRKLYVERMQDATKIRFPETDFLTDVDSGFYCSSYLRAWAFEAHLRDFLREEFGRAWFTRTEAGSLLRELWSVGQQPTADELVGDLAGTGLELAAVAARVEEELR